MSSSEENNNYNDKYPTGNFNGNVKEDTATNKANIRSINDRLVVLETEFKKMKEDVSDFKTNSLLIDRDTRSQQQHIDAIKQSIKELNDSVERDFSQLRNEVRQEFTKYVSLERYKPVELVCFGMAGGILLTVLGAILGTVIIK